ncbi:MAG: hypothetical protein R3300_09880 [Candidatus Promineifilaceae bacterium]|nr:hypothetical protein [Candidatus Promineifilaceae bacterium]
MALTQWAGIAILIGFVVFWLGNIYSPPGVYQESDLTVRLKIVDEYSRRWAVSQGLGGAGIAVALLGLLILSIGAANDNGPWLTYLPAALNAVTVVLLAVWLTQYIGDPASIWGRVEQSPLMLGASILILVAGILYGLLFRQIGLAGWLSYLTIGYAGIALVAVLMVRPPAFVIISFYSFVLLAAALELFFR